MVDLIAMLFTAACMLLLSVSVFASEEDLPSTELLEFLGEWDTKEGDWFDPLWILKNLSSKSESNDEVTEDE